MVFYANLDITPEQYFTHIEKTINRYFGNHIHQKDAEEGFMDTYDSSIAPFARVSGYNPESYEIDKTNIVPEEMSAYLSFLQIFNNPPTDYLPDMTEENIKKISPETKAKFDELVFQYVMPNSAFVVTNGIFGDEVRYICDTEPFSKARDITKNVILMDDTNDDARALKEDAIAKLCTDGLRNITNFMSIASAYSLRDYYVEFLTVSKMLDWIDNNKWLKDKIQLSEDEWSYLKGLRALGEIVCAGEVEYDNSLKSNHGRNDEAAEEYRKFTYALFLERQSTLSKNTPALCKKLDSIQQVLKNDDTFCKINCLNQYKKNYKKARVNRVYSTCEELIEIQKASFNLLPTASEIVKKLGKCTSKEQINAIVKEEAAKVGEIPQNYEDLSSFECCFRKHHTPAKKIVEPEKIAPFSNEEINKNKASRNGELHSFVMSFFKDEIKPEAEAIYSEIDLFKNDNWLRGSSDEYRNTKELLGKLVELSSKDSISRMQFRPILEALKEKTEKYLNSKDAASGQKRTQRNDDSYANRRYNLMLRCSKMVTRMLEEEDKIEYSNFIINLHKDVQDRILLPHPEANAVVMRKGIEYVLCKNSEKTSEGLKKDLLKRYYDGTLNTDQLIVDNKTDLKAVNNYVNSSILNIRKSCAQAGMSVGESEDLLVKELNTVFDTAIEKEDEEVIQRNEAFKNAKAAVKKESAENTIKRSNSF